MASSYPGAVDTFVNPTDPPDDLDTPDVAHAALHAHEADAIRATQVELGINPSNPMRTVAQRMDLVTGLVLDYANAGDFSSLEEIVERVTAVGTMFNVRPWLSDPEDARTTTDEINELIDAFSAADGGTLYFESGDYHITSIDPPLAEPWWRGGIELKPNVSLYGEPGATLIWDGAGGHAIISTGSPWTGVDLPVTADVTEGDTSFTCAAGVGTLQAGDMVEVRFGQDPYDAPVYAEPLWWGFATVLSASGTTVVLDRASPVPVDISEMNDVWEGFGPFLEFPLKSFAMIRQLDPATWCQNVRIEGFRLSESDDVGVTGARIGHARNVHMSSLVSAASGTSFITHFCENVTMDNIMVEQANYGGAAYTGRGMSFAGCHTVRARAIRLEKCYGTFLFVESSSHSVQFDGLSIVDNHPGRPEGDSMIFTSTNCHVIVNGLSVEGINTGTGIHGHGSVPNGLTSLTINGLDILAGEELRLIPWYAIAGGRTRVRTPIGGVFYDGVFAPPRQWSSKFLLGPNITEGQLPLPNGILTHISVYVSEMTGLTDAVYINDAVAVVDGPSFVANLTPGQLTDISYPNGPAIDQSGDYAWQKSFLDHALVWTTDGTASASQYAVVRVTYLPIVNEDGDTWDTTGGLLQGDPLALVYNLHQFAEGRTGFFGHDPISKSAGGAYSIGAATPTRTIAAYVADTESVAYTGAADSEAKLADLNALRVAYENLRVMAENNRAFAAALAADLGDGATGLGLLNT